MPRLFVALLLALALLPASSAEIRKDQLLTIKSGTRASEQLQRSGALARLLSLYR